MKRKMKRKMKDEEKDYCFNRLPPSERRRRSRDSNRFQTHEFVKIPVCQKIERFDPAAPVNDTAHYKVVCQNCEYEPENEAHQFLEL